MNEDNINDLEFAEDLAEIFGSDPILSASIRVTKQCNLSCPHCYAYTTIEKGKRLPSELTIEEIDSLLRQLSELGCSNMFITGGEPFIRKDTPEILSRAGEYGMEIAVSTNGTLLNPEILERVRDVNFAMFQVSVDGNRQEHDRIRGSGVFAKASNSFQLLVEFGHDNRTLSCTLSTENAAIFPGMVDIADALGATRFSITMVVEAGRASSLVDNRTGRVKDAAILKDALDGFFKRYHEKPGKFRFSDTSTIPVALVPPEVVQKQGAERFFMCSFPNIIGIEADGRVALCDGFFGQDRYILGNTRDKSIKEIWDSEIYQKVRSLKPADLCGACSVCKWSEQCGGGCRASASAQYEGDLTAPDPVCQLFYDAGLFPERNIDTSRVYKPIKPPGTFRL